MNEEIKDVLQIVFTNQSYFQSAKNVSLALNYTIIKVLQKQYF
jgi:hypothetical protein